MAQPQATALEKVLIIPTMLQAVFSGLTRLFTYPFNSGARAPSLYKDVFYALLRAQIGKLNVAQEHYMNSSTEANYLDLAKKEGFQPDTVVLSDCKAFWLGAKKSKKVIVYFHGGGYVLPCSAGHFKWLFDLTAHLSKSHSISSILLAYTLAPGAQYPTQLRQAAELLTHMLEVEGKDPSDIIIAGDSAGGNLSLALFSHLLHPHPDVPEVKLSSPLLAGVLISPWVKFSIDDASGKRNEYTDMIPASVGTRWSKAFMGPAKQEPYNQPVHAGPSWFSTLDTKVREIFLWGGGGELLIDSIDAISKILKSAHPKVEYVVEPGAAHEDFIIEKLLGYTKKAEGTKLIESWIAERLGE